LVSNTIASRFSHKSTMHYLKTNCTSKHIITLHIEMEKRCNPTSNLIITLHISLSKKPCSFYHATLPPNTYISLSKIKHYTKKRKINRANQCFHSGLFFFIFKSMICIPFSIECTILFLPFPFSLATVDDIAAGVAGFLPYIFPPHPSVVLSVRSIQTGGLGYIGTFSLLDILLSGGGGLGAGAGGCLFQLGSVNSLVSSCHQFSAS
jgi:hypothetical protein